MAARATRSASRKVRGADEAVAAVATGSLSHDELGVIFDGLADPLQPVVAVALSSTCLGLRTPLRAALEVLQQRRAKAKELCPKLYTILGGVDDDFEDEKDRLQRVQSCTELSEATELEVYEILTIDNVRTLGMLMPWMSRLKWLILVARRERHWRRGCAGTARGPLLALWPQPRQK